MPREDKIVVTPQLLELVGILARNYSLATGADPVEFYEQYYLDLVPHAAVIFSIGRDFGFRETDRILEVGSGLGTRCLIGNAIFGSDFTGLEPCANTYSHLKGAIEVFQESNPHLGYHSVNRSGERTGLADASFDYLLSFEVLEHVKSPIEVVREMYRVLKPGGRIFISSCNYASFYEGHFRCLWLPFLSRRQQKKYLRLIGRNNSFLDEINCITKREMLRHFSESGFSNIETHNDYTFAPLWNFRVQYPDGYSFNRSAGKAKFIQRLVQAPRIARMLACFDREYKLYLTAEKPGSGGVASSRACCEAGA